MLHAPDFTKGKKAANTVLNLESLPKEGDFDSSISNGSQHLTPEIAAGDIEFHNVWFRYPSSKKNEWVLKNFNLNVKAGERVGLVGESGSGKSTIVQLLYRFYEPQRGYITIGGRPLAEFTLQSLRAQFGLVQQEPMLFNTSILENICYGKSHASAAEVLEAAKIADADEFIEKEDFHGDDETAVELEEKEEDDRFSHLPCGYRTLCGSRGNKLSGGQKQRIAIARAVIRSPKVLVLDEATSALDEHSQQTVQEALNRVMSMCTSIVIAHRLSTLAKCDKIVCLSEGFIIEQGTFEDLKEKGGYFADI
jgi:ABC-type multidrug transport system fused ATPase/permease subunit